MLVLFLVMALTFQGHSGTSSSQDELVDSSAFAPRVTETDTLPGVLEDTTRRSLPGEQSASEASIPRGREDESSSASDSEDQSVKLNQKSILDKVLNIILDKLIGFILLIILLAITLILIIEPNIRYWIFVIYDRVPLLRLISENSIFYIPRYINKTSKMKFEDLKQEFLLSMLNREESAQRFIKFINSAKKVELEIIKSLRRVKTNIGGIKREKLYGRKLNEQYIKTYFAEDKLVEYFLKHKDDFVHSTVFDHIQINLDIDKPQEVDVAKRKIEFAIHGKHVGLEDAQLLWDDNRSAFQVYLQSGVLTDHKYPRERPSKMDQPGFETVRQSFGQIFTEIRYDGVEVLWFDQENFWPPTIDSMVMMEKLERYTDLTTGEYTSVFDLGCGTGMLGLWLAKKNGKVKKLLFTDWLLTPLYMSLVNAQRNQILDRVNVDMFIGINGRGKKDRHKGVYDVLLCNPPYLPLDGLLEELKKSDKKRYKRRSREWSTILQSQTVAGTELLEYVIRLGRLDGKRTFINFTHLALPEAKEACELANVNLVPLGKPVLVPFRIPVAFRHPEYLRELEKQRGLIVDPADETGHFFWHNIQTYEIRKK